MKTRELSLGEKKAFCSLEKRGNPLHKHWKIACTTTGNVLEKRNAGEQQILNRSTKENKSS